MTQKKQGSKTKYDPKDPLIAILEAELIRRENSITALTAENEALEAKVEKATMLLLCSLDY